MILVDANLLLYAYNSGSPQHEAACVWLERVLDGPEQVGLPWMSILAFVRIATHAGVFRQPLSLAEARQIVREWLDCPHVVAIGPGLDHWRHLEEALELGQCRGPLVMDAELAALTAEHGARLASTDRDFGRFPGLKAFNPLEA